MEGSSPQTLGGLAYRRAGQDGDSGRGDALLVHGFPQSSYMWRSVLDSLADAGFRAWAPDLTGFGDTPASRPGTWERQIEALEEFRQAAGIERAALVVHDWGGLIGLRWACEHPEAVSALVISDSGFFADGKWHGMAEAMRTEGQGEELVGALTREAFGAVMHQASAGMDDAAIDEYFKSMSDEDRRLSVLDLYRSGEFSKLSTYEGQLAALGVPTLLLWAENDDFAPVAGAHRFAEEIPGSELVVVAGARHFLYDDEPERAAREITRFLSAQLPAA